MAHDWQGGRSRSHHRYEEDDEEPQPVYIGVPSLTHGYSKRRRRKHRSQREKHHTHHDQHTHHDHHHDNQEHYEDEEEMEQHDIFHPDSTVSPAAERLRYILGEDDDLPTPTLFTEMDTLQHDGDDMEWKESARWVKFEEKVEEGGERWSKPHVSTLTLHSLFELRTCIQTGSVLLDLEGYSLPQIVDDIVDRQVADGLIGPELREKVSFVLLRKHRHQHKKPMHRSLADMGKSNNSPASRSPQSVHNASRTNFSRSPSSASGLHRSTEDLRAKSGSLARLHSQEMFPLSCVRGRAAPLGLQHSRNISLHREARD